MKKGIALALTFLTLVSLSSCHATINVGKLRSETEESSGDTAIVAPDTNKTDAPTGQYGGEWPENEFTRLVPKPDFELVGAVTASDEFTVLFNNVKIADLREYVEKIKESGFTFDVETTDTELFGISAYQFSAENNAGYSIEISSASGTTTFSIERDD